MAGLIYHHLFTPREISDFGEFQTKHEQTETQVRIAKDHDGDKERIFRLPLIKDPPPDLFQVGDDVTINVRLGHSLHAVNYKDPLYVAISDGKTAAIGFKITGNEKIKGVEGVPERFFNVTRQSGDDSQTSTISYSDYPDEFFMSVKPEQYWGTLFCSQGNGTKQCVGYGKKPELTQGVYLEFYRETPTEEYVMNYIEVSIYCVRKTGTTNNTAIPGQIFLGGNQVPQNFEQKVKQRETIMQQLKDMKSLEDAKVITTDEFNKLKEKILNELLSLN